MAKSKLSYKRNVTDQLSVKGVLSEDATEITYVDENDFLISTIKIFYPNDNLVVKIQFSHWDSGEIRKDRYLSDKCNLDSHFSPISIE